jgi:hypothetical protein
LRACWQYPARRPARGALIREKGSVLPTTEAVPEEIEVTCVAGGLVDHVHEDPPKVDRADPERGNRCDMVE